MSASHIDHDHGDTAALPPKVVEVADRVFAYVQPDGSWWINNTGFVRRQTARSCRIDTCSTERRTRAYLDAMVETVAGLAPRVLVNTHHHGDHTNGNCLLPFATDRRPHAVPRGDAADGHPALSTASGSRSSGASSPRPRLRDLRATASTSTSTTCGSSCIHFDRRRPHDQRRRRVDPRAPGPVHRRPRLQRRHALRPHGLGRRLDRGAGSPRRSSTPPSSCPGHGEPCGARDASSRCLVPAAWSRRPRPRRTRPGLTPLEAARDADLGAFAELLDPERLVGNLHRAFAECDGAPPGAPIDVAAALLDMVTYNGGVPLRCMA